MNLRGSRGMTEVHVVEDDGFVFWLELSEVVDVSNEESGLRCHPFGPSRFAGA